LPTVLQMTARARPLRASQAVARLTPPRAADVLAGRKTVGAISGKVLYGGRHAGKNFLRRYTGYVEQFGAPRAPRRPARARPARKDALVENIAVFEVDARARRRARREPDRVRDAAVHGGDEGGHARALPREVPQGAGGRGPARAQHLPRHAHRLPGRARHLGRAPVPAPGCRPAALPELAGDLLQPGPAR